MKTNFNIISKLLFLCIAVTAISCGPRVRTTKVTDNDLGAYKTFAYLPNGNFEDLARDFDDAVGEEVINSVNRNMEKIGYSVNQDNPDLLVLVSTKTDREVNVTQEPVYATYPNYYGSAYGVGSYYSSYAFNGYAGYNGIIGYGEDINAYQEGNLMISIVDKNTKQVVWRGSASNIIKKDNTSEAIAQYVDDMFEEYPVKAGS